MPSPVAPASVPEEPAADQAVGGPPGLEETLTLAGAEDSGAEVDSAQVRGRVLDPNGLPLADFVVAVRTNEPAPYPRWVQGGTVVRASSDGTFTCRSLYEGPRVVVVAAEGFAVSSSEPFQTVSGATTSDVIVHMSGGGSIAGRVLDKYTGEPIEGAGVCSLGEREIFGAFVPPRPVWAQAKTDSAGRFVLERVSPGAHRLQIEARGHATIVVSDVNVGEGDRTELPPQALLTGATINGSVHGPGELAAGAGIQLTPIDAVVDRTTRADASGRFTIENVLPGTYRLMAWRANAADPLAAVSDMMRSEIEVFVWDGARLELDLDLGTERR